MTQPDTSREAVEQLLRKRDQADAGFAAEIERNGITDQQAHHLATARETTATLRALLAERDAARAEADARGYECAQATTHAHTLTEELAQAMAERDAALSARDDAIRRLGDAARDAGRWRGISEGKDIVIKQLEAERDALRAEIAEAREALQPFAFLARVNEKLNLDPELPLKDFVPGVWPKWKDVKRALAALREAGHE